MMNVNKNIFPCYYYLYCDLFCYQNLSCGTADFTFSEGFIKNKVTYTSVNAFISGSENRN